VDLNDLFDFDVDDSPVKQPVKKSVTPVVGVATKAKGNVLSSNPPPRSRPAAPPPPSTEKRDGNIAAEFREDFLHWLVNGKTEPPRAPGLHCSSLWKTCPRVPLLEKKYAEFIKIEKDSAGQRLTYDVGHALHDMVQNGYLNDFGRLHGNWVCLACSPDKDGEPVIVHTGTLPRTCPKCETPWRYGDGTKNIVYAEMFVADEVLKYCGHCDGLLFTRAGNMVVFEFKTISKSQYGGLRGPKHEHIVQVHAYMNALGLKSAIVLYMDKGSQADWKKLPDGWSCKNPHLKVFEVKFDDALWADISKRIQDYHRATEKAKKLPVIEESHINEYERICTHKGCDMAGDCSVRDLCFAI